jgi:hypothetical protein
MINDLPNDILNALLLQKGKCPLLIWGVFYQTIRKYFLNYYYGKT